MANTGMKLFEGKFVAVESAVGIEPPEGVGSGGEKRDFRFLIFDFRLVGGGGGGSGGDGFEQWGGDVLVCEEEVTANAGVGGGGRGLGGEGSKLGSSFFIAGDGEERGGGEAIFVLG